MEYKNFKDNISLSRLGMGNMRLPILEGQPDTAIDYEKAQEMIDYGMSQGINYYDTAYVYHGGESEKFLGKALKKYPRDSYYLATKFNIMASRDYQAVFEEQLERLDMDRIDFYLIHAMTDISCQNYLDCGCIEYFLEQKEKGRIRYLGFSSHASVECLKKFISHHDWDFAQMQMNYYDWSYGSARKEYDVFDKHGVPIMVMEPVRGGRLAELTPEAEEKLRKAHPNWSMASWALRWVKRLPNVQVILSGMSTFSQIQDNVATFGDDYALDDEEEVLLMQACDMFKEQMKVPCTACRYCCDSCPAEINIPEILKVYDKFKMDGAWPLKTWLAEAKSKGKPQDCVACGACTSHCPQNIGVPDLMKELADAVK